jgi:hypothetical protein
LIFVSLKDRDIPDAGKHVNNMNEMSKLLEEYQTELEALNFEEKLFKFELSQFPMLFQIRQLKQPYDDLWITFARFQSSEAQWMKGRSLSNLN